MVSLGVDTDTLVKERSLENTDAGIITRMIKQEQETVNNRCVSNQQMQISKLR